MNEFRLRDEKANINSIVNQVEKDMTEIRVEESKTLTEERLNNWESICESNHPINYEVEEFKKKHDEEIETIKQQLLSIKKAYDKEKEEWEAQRIEIEQELNELKSKYILDDKPEDISKDLPFLQYDYLI